MHLEFSFSLTGCHAKVKEPSLPRRRVLASCEMQTASPRIWTRATVSISNNYNHGHLHQTEVVTSAIKWAGFYSVAMCLTFHFLLWTPSSLFVPTFFQMSVTLYFLSDFRYFNTIHTYENNVYVCAYVCMYMFMCMRICACVCVCVSVCVYMCVYVYVSMYACACVYACVCVCTHACLSTFSIDATTAWPILTNFVYMQFRQQE